MWIGFGRIPNRKSHDPPDDFWIFVDDSSGKRQFIRWYSNLGRFPIENHTIHQPLKTFTIKIDWKLRNPIGIISIINPIILHQNPNYNRLKPDCSIHSNISNLFSTMNIKIFNLIILYQNPNSDQLRSDYSIHSNISNRLLVSDSTDKMQTTVDFISHGLYYTKNNELQVQTLYWHLLHSLLLNIIDWKRLND